MSTTRVFTKAVDGAATALIVDDQSVTWDALEARIGGFASVIEDSGLQPEDRVAVLAMNGLDFVALAFASLALGTRLVPINWHLAPPEIDYLLQDSGARMLFVQPELASLVDGCATPTTRLDEQIEPLLATGSNRPLPVGRAAGQPLIYTGGTTGRSKGVWRASKHDLPTTVSGLAAWGTRLGFPTDGRGLVTTPLYHAWGLSSLSTMLCSGISVVIRPRFDEYAMLADIERYRVSILPLVPAQMIRLAKIDRSERASSDVSSLRFAVHTAAPCPEWAKRELINWWGPIITEYYGSSDGAGPVVCTSTEWLERPGTVGRPVPGVEVRIVDDRGEQLPPRAEGSIYFRRADGPPQYFGDSEKSKSILLGDGFYTVGDYGYVDEDGFLYLVDRRDDLILVGGTNVYSAEVESVLSAHPAVRDVAVVGVADDALGQVVRAFVQREPDTDVDEHELREFCATHLARFKVPKVVTFVEELPREAHGKLKKRLLRDRPH